MEKFENATKGFILICVGLVTVDLVLKSLILSNFGQGEIKQIAGGLFSVGHIETTRMAFGAELIRTIMPIATIILQIVFVFLFLKIQRLPIHKLFKYASTMIVFGWIGFYLDKYILFYGQSGHVQLDYFTITGLGSFMNISNVLIYVGWISFIAAMIISFQDFKEIIGKVTNA